VWLSAAIFLHLKSAGQWPLSLGHFRRLIRYATGSYLTGDKQASNITHDLPRKQTVGSWRASNAHYLAFYGLAADMYGLLAIGARNP
jgi:hypothetical protein